MKKAKYVCIEGVEGVGKTTQTQKLVDHLRSKGFKVLQTKEPGTSLLPLTMQLRAIMLDAQYEDQLTVPARELISQAIRSIHMDKLIVPSMAEYDFIIQDRGILSGLSYGMACGVDLDTLSSLISYVTYSGKRTGLITDESIYDSIIYLKGNASKNLKRALDSKKEFENGDAMELRGDSFLETVAYYMQEMAPAFKTKVVNVDNKNIETVFEEILSILESEGLLHGEKDKTNE